MLEAAQTAKKLLDDEENFRDFTEDLRDKEGIDIALMRKHSGHMRRHREEEPELKEGFNITNISRTNIKLLIYDENLPDGRVLTLRTSLSVMSAHKHEMNIFNILTTVVAVLLSMVIGRIFSKKITQNIKKLNLVARKISVLDFSEKALVNTGDEIEELSRNIDIMSKNLSLSIDNLKAFASNASHELRTPITVINTHAQALINGIVKDEKEKMNYYRAIAKESREMNELVGNLLTISRLSSPGIKLNIEELDFIKLLKESIEKYEILELEKDIEWKIKINSLNILCDRKIFKIAVDNIIHNALKYSKDNEAIEVYEEDEKIKIKNSIAGDNIEDIEKLWEPFARGNNANELRIDGNGLGLSIVKEIMKLNKIQCGIEIKEKKFIFWFDIFRS